MTAIDPFVGKTLQNRYRVVERLAEGAMGVVYRGERLTLNRVVAIKFLHPAVAQQENLRRRFELEAQAMARLCHPNCVSVIDFGVQDVPYLVMDFVSGKNMRQVLSDGGVSAARAANIARQLLTALVHAHAHGIVHRDIKPENLILEQSAGLEDHLRVLDFGLAKLVNSDAGLTAGTAVGTPNYVAPEQLQAGETDARADLYATGIVLFEMLTGRQPFAADSMGEVLRRQLQMPPPRLRQIAPEQNFSEALEHLVWKAMAKKPEERFPTAQAMLDELERVPQLQLAPAQSPAAQTPAIPAADATMQLSSHDNIAGSRTNMRTYAVIGGGALLMVLIIYVSLGHDGKQAQQAAAPPAPVVQKKEAPPDEPRIVSRQPQERATPTPKPVVKARTKTRRTFMTHKASSAERWGTHWGK